jgi:hypothetical protein
MLQIENTSAEVTAIGPVARKMGNSGEYDHGMFIALHIESTSADHLDQMEKGLRKSLYKKVSKQRKKQAEEDQQSDMLPEREDDMNQPRYAGKMKSFPWDDIVGGYTVVLGSGLTATTPRTFEKAEIKNFKISIKDGGTIALSLTAIVDCDREHKGWLCEQLRGTLQLSLIPPGAEQTEMVVEEEEEESVEE